MLRSNGNLRSFISVLCLTMTAALTLASTAQAQAAGASASPLMNLVPFVVMLGIMYVLMIRPQSKKAQVHKDFLEKLKRGDEVLTASGILGRVEGLTDAFVTLEISPGVRIKILRKQVMSFLPSVTESAEVKA